MNPRPAGTIHRDNRKNDCGHTVSIYFRKWRSGGGKTHCRKGGLDLIGVIRTFMTLFWVPIWCSMSNLDSGCGYRGLWCSS